MSDGLVASMREDALANLYVFSKLVCGFDKFKVPLHRDVCDFLQNDEALRKMLLMPRDHYKSSAVIAYLLWRLCRNPEERILIAGDTAGTAQKKLTKLTAIIETSQMLRALFPEILPKDKSKQRWSAEAITINRKGAHAEDSITALGVGGARAGAHYTLIVCDDIATLEAAKQPSTMALTIEWADGLEAMLEQPYLNQILVVGTPWSYDDVYGHLDKSWGKGTMSAMETGLKFYTKFERGFFDEIGDPIFPELYGGRANAMDFAERMARTNPYLWSCNYLLKPQIPNAELRVEDLQYYTISNDGRYLLYKSLGMDEPMVQPLDTLKTCIAVDPAFKKDPTASKAAISVQGYNSQGDIFVLESVGGRFGTDMLIEKIIEQINKYGRLTDLRKLLVEAAGQQQGFIDYLAKELRSRGLYIRPQPEPPPSTLSKKNRIRASLQPLVGQKRMWFGLGMSSLFEEMSRFPLTEQVDELDALSLGADKFSSKAGVAMSQRLSDDNLRRFEEARATANEYTGY